MKQSCSDSNDKTTKLKSGTLAHPEKSSWDTDFTIKQETVLGKMEQMAALCKTHACTKCANSLSLSYFCITDMLTTHNPVDIPHLQSLQLCLLLLYILLLSILLPLPCLLLMCESVLQVTQFLQLLVVPVWRTAFTPIILTQLGLVCRQLSLKTDTKNTRMF